MKKTRAKLITENITKNRGIAKWAGKVGPFINHCFKSIQRTNIARKCALFEVNIYIMITRIIIIVFNYNLKY